MRGKKVQSLPGVFVGEMVVINIGIPAFARDLERQGVRVVQLEWSPPAGGDLDLLEMLEKLGA